MWKHHSLGFESTTSRLVGQRSNLRPYDVMMLLKKSKSVLIMLFCPPSSRAKHSLFKENQKWYTSSKYLVKETLLSNVNRREKSPAPGGYRTYRVLSIKPVYLKSLARMCSTTELKLLLMLLNFITYVRFRCAAVVAQQ